MREVADEYLRLMGNLRPNCAIDSNDVEMFSSVTGDRIEENYLDAAYWVQNLVMPVQFMDALRSMCFSRLEKHQQSLRMDAGASNVLIDVLIEVGPHGALQSAIKETLSTRADTASPTSLSVLNRSSPGVSTILETVGTLKSKGYPVNVQAVNDSQRSVSFLIAKKGMALPRLIVSLPGYKFDHSEGLMHESRLSRNYRQRKYPRHDLFGAPVSDWNPDSPRWRHIIRLSEQPWIRDHIVTGAFVYPGVGYLIAVIEASRQIADQKLKISGFRLRDVSLKRALIIPDTKDGVETSLSLTRMDESSLWGSSTWRKFQMSSYNSIADDWIEHCTGYIAVDYETGPGPIDQGREATQEALMWKKTLEDVNQRCTIPMDMESAYDSLITTGLTFGPLFKNLSNARGTAGKIGEVVGTVKIPNVSEAMPKKYAHEHLIHPATMDSMMHLFLASAMDRSGKKTLERPMVPTFIKETWVSGEVNSKPGGEFLGYGSSKYLAYDKYEADVMVWDATSKEPRISIKGIRSSPLESADNDLTKGRKLCHVIKWSPYQELITPASFKNVALMGAQESSDYRIWINKHQLATLLMVVDALEELDKSPPLVLDGHLLKYFKWMKQLRQWLDQDQVSGMRHIEWEKYAQDPVAKEELLKEVKEHNADGELAVRMGSNIVKVLRKEVDPLDLMFGQDDILDRVYEEVVKLGDLPALQKSYLEAVRENSTDLYILEVGAGTGSSTAAVVDSLSSIATEGQITTSSINTYTFTDISSAFFEKAKEKFKQYRDIMEFKTLDAEKDVVKQGFKLATYDFIVAGNVVHATADLRRTLGNLRQLLKPGGKLILHEGVRQDLFWSPLAFGQLHGWWLGVEPIRQWSPWITVTQWDTVLKDSGFTGIDLNLQDRQDSDLHTQSLMIATAVESTMPSTVAWDEVIIVTTTPILEGSNEIVTALQAELDRIGVSRCRVVHYLDLALTALSQSICISVVDFERAVLYKATEEEFSNIRQMLSSVKASYGLRLIWLSVQNSQ